MKKKGFVISWYFPPINSSEGTCTFKLLKNSKYEYDVYTQKNNKSWSYDTNEDKMTAPNIHTIFSESSSIEDWVQKGIQYGEENLEKYDFMMSRSMAPESHEIALALKKEFPDMKWIASFGDPLAENPYIKLIEPKSPYRVRGTGVIEKHSIFYVLSPKRILKHLYWTYRDQKYKRKHTRYYKDIKLQEEVLKRADKIIFNNTYQMEFMLKDYPEEIKEKAIYLPHGYDLDLFPPKEKKKNDKYIMSYLGHLDETRTPKNLFEALCRVKEKKPNLYKTLEFDIYGNMSDKDKAFLVDHELCDVVRFKKPIKYQETLRIMQQSDLLVLVDANLGKLLPKNIFYAAKLADYVGSGSNIFSITMIDGPSADITKEVGGVVSSHSVDDIYNHIVMILEGKIKISNNQSKEYDMKTITKKYDEEVEKLCK